MDITRQRTIDAITELSRRFIKLSLTVKPNGNNSITVNGLFVTVDEKQTGSDWHKVGTGKLYVRFNDENSRSKLFHEKRGTFDYQAITDTLVETLEAIKSRHAYNQRMSDLNKRIKQFKEDNNLSIDINTQINPYKVSAICRDEAQMYEIMLLIDGVLKRARVATEDESDAS